MAKEKVGETAKPLISCKLLSLVILAFAVIAGIFISRLSNTIDPVAIAWPKPRRLSGPLQTNSRLNSAGRLYHKKLVGPTSIVLVKDVIYTGVANGSILKIEGNEISIFCQLTQKLCVGPKQKPCSRPMGMRLDAPRHRLLVVDAYQGIFEVSLTTGKAKQLFPLASDKLFKVTFLSDIDVLPDGRFVITEVSTKYPAYKMVDEVLEARPNGRVLIVNAVKGTATVLADSLYLPSGVQLHADRKSVLVSETGQLRILRIALDGKSPPMEFMVGVPGLPAHIRPAENGGYWVGVPFLRYSGSPCIIMDIFGKWPAIRHLFHKVLGSQALFDLAMKPHSLVIRLNDDGQVMETLHDMSGKVTGISEVAESNGFLYFGSMFADYIGKLRL